MLISYYALLQNNISIFSKEALAERNRKADSNADEWLEKYMKDVYVPTVDDFRRLRKTCKKYRQIYEGRCRDIEGTRFMHIGAFKV